MANIYITPHTGDVMKLITLRGNPCTACALRATFRLGSPQRAPSHAPSKRP